jgi:hypothetical protein
MFIVKKCCATDIWQKFWSLNKSFSLVLFTLLTLYPVFWMICNVGIDILYRLGNLLLAKMAFFQPLQFLVWLGSFMQMVVLFLQPVITRVALMQILALNSTQPMEVSSHFITVCFCQNYQHWNCKCF